MEDNIIDSIRLIKLLLFVSLIGISFSQLRPGQISLAGWGYTEDRSDTSSEYKKYNRTEITSVVSYNINPKLSIDTKFNMINRDRTYSNNHVNNSSTTEFSIGPTYFLNNNFYFSYLYGISWNEGKYSTDAIAASGYWDWYCCDQWGNWDQVWIETSPAVPGGTTTYESDTSIGNIVLGYRLYITSFASLDIGYNLYSDEDGDTSSQIEFLLRMFL